MSKNNKQEDSTVLKYPIVKVSEDSLEEKIRILIADDDEQVLDLLKTHLGERGFEVYTCRTGNEAIDFLDKKGEIIDICLTDIVLPGIPGDDVIKKIKNDPDYIKIMRSKKAEEAPGII